MCDIAVEMKGTRNLASSFLSTKNPEHCYHMATLNACFQKYMFDSREEK